MSRLPLLALLLAAPAGCASPTAIQSSPWIEESLRLGSNDGPVPSLPDARSIGAAFNRPIMQGCDELTCWYSPFRLFSIRALKCSHMPSDWPNSVQAHCRYQRQLVPRKGRPGPWHAAETHFGRFTDPASPAREWHVLRDLTPD